MDWTQMISPALGFAGIVAGGVIAKRKPRTDAHSVVVADAIVVSKEANERANVVSARLDDALRRIDSLEDRENRRDNLARQHLRWDWSRVRELADLGVTVVDPPPLFIYDEPTKGH